MNFIEHVMAAERFLDLANGAFGSQYALCLFCSSTQYNSVQGIVHKTTCPVAQLRVIIAEVRES